VQIRRWAASAAAATAAAVMMAAQAVPSAQRVRGGQWVGTWATAVVARPQGPAAAPQPFGAGFPAPQCFGEPPKEPAVGAAPTAPVPAAPAQAAAAARNGGPGPGAVGRGQGGGGRGPAGPPINFSNQTLRQIVHTSIGGDRVRVVLSNVFGTAPLAIGAAHVALRDKGAAIVPRTGRVLTFGGSPIVNIPPGASVVSDAANLAVPPLSDLAIDVYLPGDTSSSPLTMHTGALQTNYVSEAGNHTGAPDLPGASTTTSWFFLARVEVSAPEGAGAIVAFGDSITDGTRSTPDANARWPDALARRLLAQKINLGVLNEGIAGNRVLADGAGVSALARFDRDAIAQAGASYVIVLESINDIGLGREGPCPSAGDLIAAHQQLIERAHARGMRIYGATLTPFEGAAYWTREGEAKRRAVNDWIRSAKAYDGVIDFDAAVRDPNAPTRIRPQYNPGDNLHMNDAGYQAMADAIDLALFRQKK